MYQLPGGIVIQTRTETQSTDTDTDGEARRMSVAMVQLGIGSRQHRSDTVMMRNGGVVASGGGDGTNGNRGRATAADQINVEIQ